MAHKTPLKQREKQRVWRENNPNYNRSYYEKNQEHLRAKRQQRQAENPHKNRESCRRYRAANREKERERVNRWRIKNREKANAQTHRWRARKLSYIIGDPVVIQRRIDEIYTEACVWCGAVDNIHVDHIWPLSKGGPHAAYNLQALCSLCNVKKGNRILLQLPEKC